MSESPRPDATDDMRLPSHHRRRARQGHQPLGLTLAALVALAPTASQAIEFKAAPPANLDFSSLGRIAIAGDFNGISLYEYEGQIGKPRSNNGSESLLAPLPNGAMASIVSTDASIRSMCSFKLKNGQDKGIVIGGNFTSLDGTKSTAIALFDPNTAKVTPLDGLEGEVNSVFCDNERETVFVGGNFDGANSTNALAWVGNDGWNNLPFAGFNGPVSAISKSSNGHIIFGGRFTGLGNLTATPGQPDSHIINFSGARIVAENSISRDGFSDPKNLACSSGADTAGNTWLLADGQTGFWEAQFDFMFQPSKLRLWNTHQDGRGTKTFRYNAYPDHGIMNFTYVDPSTGKNATCTSECPLSHDDNVKFQDFHFVNRVGMNRFRLSISDSYGPGGGFAGVELFHNNIDAYAFSSANDPKCRGIDFPSTATATGPWAESPSLQSNANYLVAKVKGDVKPEDASVVFYPNIQESGNYSVNMYTPGCIPDGSCESRGRVNVTGTMSVGSGAADFTTSFFQTNNFDKYDQIYFGYIEKTSDSFKPSVTLTPMPDDKSKDMTVVAQRVGFSLINSKGGLNGLFEYDPSKPKVDTTNFASSAINKLGSGFEKMAGVKTLATAGDVTYIGGNFTSKANRNVVALSNNKDVKSLDGGLDGGVLSMHLEGNQLYVGGQFSRTAGSDGKSLPNIAIYDTDKNTWSPVGAGVNGKVEFVVPLKLNLTKDTPETVIALTGAFSQCNKFKDSDAIMTNGFAVWVPSQGNWLENSKGPVPSFSGTLTASFLGLPKNGSLLAGSLSSAALSADGSATVNKNGLGPFPVKMKSSSSSSDGVQRRDTSSQAPATGVVTGAFYDEDGKNLTVLAGHFEAESSDGKTINNLVLIDGKNKDTITGLGPGISKDSVFSAVALQGTVIYAGGKVSGKIDGADVNGVIAYDIVDKSFKNQPASISGLNATVAAITVRPKTSEVYVGGSFDKAGALGCPGICVYNSDADQWTRPGNDVGGQVTGLMWQSNSRLVAVGNLTTNGTTQRSLAIYDANKQSWTAFPGSEKVPGPVDVMTPGSSDGEQVWVAGKSSKDQSLFVMKYDGSEWHATEQKLPPTTQLRSLQMFTLTEDQDSTDILKENQALMLTGIIDLPGVGTVSAALYNGTHYQPYALTTSTGIGAGSIAKVFSQNDSFFKTNKKHMPLVFVVLIGLAISLGLILLLVVAGIVLDRIRKKREGYTPAPTSMYDRGSGMQRIPPRELLESLGNSRPGAPPHV